LEIKTPSCRLAGVVSGQAGFADVGPQRVDRARRCDPDLADEGRTAIAIGSHAPTLIVDIFAGNAAEVGVIFQ